jgi:L-type amino acid transporter 9
LSEVAGPGGDKLEGADAAEDDAVYLKRRVGLFSGVALIVGTMIGEYSFDLRWGGCYRWDNDR